MDDEGYKAFDAILKQDERSKNVGLVRPRDYGTLEGWHAYVDSVQLNHTTPDDVQRNFNRAKNLSLYAWYVYDFHQVAEMDAISTFEMALKKKFKQHNMPIPQGLNNLYCRAIEEGWISEHRENYGRFLAKYRNDLAHGTTVLHEQSVRTLEICALYINQLFVPSDKCSHDDA